MRSQLLFVIGLLLLLGTVAHAQVIQFPNGSFETSTLSDWNSLGLGSDINSSSAADCDVIFYQGASSSTGFTPSENPTLETNPPFAPDGFYFIDFQDNTNAANDLCEKFRNTSLSNFDAGSYRFSFDFNKLSGTALVELAVVVNDTNLACGLTTASGAGTYSCSLNSASDFNVQFFITSRGDTVVSRTIVDNFRYEQTPTLEMFVEEEGDPFPVDTNFSLTNEIFLDTNSMEVTDATCTVNWGGSNNSMPFNSSIGKYELTKAQSAPGVVNYVVGCSRSGYISDQNVSGSVTFTVSLTGKLIVTDIENVTHTLNATNVDFFPTNESDEIIYSIENDYTTSLIVPQTIFNSLTDGKQYWIYTATPGQFDQNIWVFDDSLTFGLTSSDPIQKIWNSETEQYEYTFSDTLVVGELKYYKLSYLAPFKHYYSLKDVSDWVVLLQPNQTDGNGINVDQYSINNFSNIRSYYIEPIPDITQDEFQTETYELQFTAWASVASTLVYGGYTNYDVDNVSSISLTTTPHRYSISIDGNNFNSQMLFKTLNNTFANVFMTDYAIVPRGYFTKRLELFKSNGEPLDLFLILNQSEKYLVEGKDFKISTQAYDVDGKLQTMTIQAFFENTNQDVNQVSEIVTDLDTSPEQTFNFDQVIDGIVDLNGNAVNPTSPRNLIIKATLFDSDGIEFAIQSQLIKFVQFPYFGGDFTINFFPTEKQKGKNPAGILSFTTLNINTLIGFDIRIYDSNTSIVSPDYQTRIYKDTDFNCPTGDCQIQLKISDFIFEDANVVHVVITAMLNTEYFSLNNYLIQIDRTIFITPIEFDVLKIYQTKERIDRTYRNDEEIAVVLVAKTSEAIPTKEKIGVYLTIQNCNDINGTSCVNQTTKYNPTGYLYDSKFNLNYYFFQNLFLLDNGQLLPDGNWIGFHAHVSDNQGIISPDVAVLADKCQNQNYLADFLDELGNPVGMLSFLFNAASNLVATAVSGCQAGSEQFDKVTTTVNNSQEVRLLIDASHSLSDPKQNVLFCVAPDQNNVVDEPLKQDLICGVIYSTAETQIDKFRLQLTNKYSDLSKKGIDKQFKEYSIPYELIAINDPQLLKQQLEVNTGTEINTIQEFLFFGLKNTVGNVVAYSGLQDIANFTLGNGIIANVGATFDLSADFNSASVPGIVIFKVKGVPVLNAQDYKSDQKVQANFQNIDRKKFIEYLSSVGISIPTNTSSVEVYSSDVDASFKVYDNEGTLVIDELPSTQPVNTSNLDANQNSPYQYIPAQLLFTIQSTMFFNNDSEDHSLVIVLKILDIIPGNLANTFTDFVTEVANGTFDFGKALLSMLPWFFILIALLIGLGIVYRNFKTNGDD